MRNSLRSRMQCLITILLLTALFVPMQVAISGKDGTVNIPDSFIISPQSASAHTAKEQKELHKKWVEAEQCTDADAAAMVPGRTWTWELDAQQSLQHLSVLRSDLNILKDDEGAFEASLASVQASEFHDQMVATNELIRHVEQDLASLEDELRKGSPRRWHVARDALDMKKEIHKLKKLYGQIASSIRGH